MAAIKSVGNDSNQSLLAVAAASKVCQDWQHPKSTDYKIGACKSISWRASVEVCQWDGSNQVLTGPSNQVLAKIVKQSSLGQEGQAIKESLGSESNQGVSR